MCNTTVAFIMHVNMIEMRKYGVEIIVCLFILILKNNYDIKQILAGLAYYAGHISFLPWKISCGSKVPRDN